MSRIRNGRSTGLAHGSSPGPANAGRRKALAAGILLGLAAVNPARPADVSVVRVVARRFRFEPETIRLPLGKPVLLEVTNPDEVLHGFSVPALGIRGDVAPGVPLRLSFTPTRAGRFVVVCDNFCGDDHDDMSGYLVVA